MIIVKTPLLALGSDLWHLLVSAPCTKNTKTLLISTAFKENIWHILSEELKAKYFIVLDWGESHFPILEKNFPQSHLIILKNVP